MKAASVVWEDVALNKHLASPKGFIPGNYMGDSFPSGVASQSDRSALIDYLKTLK
jgi:cytochrome c2